MQFTQKIYLNEKEMVLTTNGQTYVSEHAGASRYPVFENTSVATIRQAIGQLDRDDVPGIIIQDSSPDQVFAQLQTLYHALDAAGGVVLNEKGELLLIYRRGKWDLPKGKLDAGENLEECALREVSEETGLVNLSITKKVCDTYHIYTQNNEQLLKRTAWYGMKGTTTDKLKPQKEENIVEARWIPLKELAPFLSKTYEAIKDVIRTAGINF